MARRTTFEFSGLGHNDTLELIDNGADTNEPPILTAFAAPVATAAHNTETEITFADLAAQGDEADSDGSVTAFIVVARDNDLALSSPPVQATVDVLLSPDQPASAWIAYHDMGGPAYAAGLHITNPYVSSSNSVVASPTPATVGLIRHADGTPTGVSVNITGINSFDNRTGVVLPPAAGTPADTLFNGVGLDLTRGTLNRQNGLMTITISGLDSNQFYDLAFYGDRTAFADGTEQFSLGGADSATNSSSTGIASTNFTNQETRSNGGSGNPGDVIRWTDINPGADGIITVEIDPRVTDGTSTTNIVHLNAMRLENLPTQGGDTFAEWIAGFELDGQTGLTDDSDGDGIPNAIENFFGTHPGEFSQGLVPVSATNGTFTFTHPITADPASDLTATYRWSKDLVQFHDGGATDADGTTVDFARGTPTGGWVDVSNVEIHDMKGKGTRFGIRIKSAKVRGGAMRDIFIHDMEMDGVANPFHWELNWFPKYSYPPRPKAIPEAEWPAHWHVLLTPVDPPERGIPGVRDIRTSNVRVTNANLGLCANAYPERPIRNVVFENVSIEAKTGGSLNHCQDWSMRNVTLRCKSQVSLKSSKDVALPSMDSISNP